MKRITFLISFCLLIVLLQAQPQTFIYSQYGEKFFFEKNDNIQYVNFLPNVEIIKRESILRQMEAFAMQIEEITPNIYRCHIQREQISNFTNTIKSNNKVALYSSEYNLPGFKTRRWAFNNLYVNVKEGFDIEMILQLANLSYQLIEPVGSIPRTFNIQIENEDIFLASQRLFETGNVVYALPSFYYLQAMETTFHNQEHFGPDRSSNDWNLKDCSFYGINAINAWNITTGNPNISIGIVDDGIKLDHLYLMDNLLPGYTAPRVPWLPSGNGGATAFLDRNGTRVAGIISSTNNTATNYGIVKNSKIIPIKVRDGAWQLVDPDEPPYHPEGWLVYSSSDYEVTEGLLWLMNNTNVDIIIFAWPFDEIQFGHEAVYTIAPTVIEPILNSVITSGRNGKGIVCVAGSGNSGANSVFAPASFDKVIAVGAIGSDGKRVTSSPAPYPNMVWGSSYGTQLDVVAPGKNITTTCTESNSCYMNNYSSTGAAAAHVAGVAALILSVNPCLTAIEVKNIIEQTACKAQNTFYSYTTTPNRPNGTWNEQMGYGLVDAYKALQYTLDLYLQNETETGTILYQAVNKIEAGKNVTNTVPVGNYTIQSGADVTFRAGNTIILSDGFVANIGAKYHAYLDPDFDCMRSFLAPPSDNGVEFVSINNNSGDEKLESKIVEGLSINGKSLDFNILPNPNHGTFQLETNFPLTEIVSLKVIDLLGVSVYETKNLLSNSIQLQIPSNGLYFVVIVLNDGLLLTQKMLIQKQ